MSDGPRYTAPAGTFYKFRTHVDGIDIWLAEDMGTTPLECPVMVARKSDTDFWVASTNSPQWPTYLTEPALNWFKAYMEMRGEAQPHTSP